MTRPRIAGVLLAAGMGRRFGGPKALADTGDGPWVVRALGTLASLEPRIVVVGAEADRVRALLPGGVIAADNPEFASGMGSSLVAGLRALDVGAVDAAVVMLVDLPDVPAAAIERVVAVAVSGAGASGPIECDADRAPAGSVVAGPTGGIPDDSPAVSSRAATSPPGEVPAGSPAGSAATRPAGVVPAGVPGASLAASAADGPASVVPAAGAAGRTEDGVTHAVRQSLVRATFHGSPGHPVLIGADHFAGVIQAAGGDRGARDYLATHPVMAVECGDLAGGEDVDRNPSGADRSPRDDAGGTPRDDAGPSPSGAGPSPSGANGSPHGDVDRTPSGA